jgi:hypothetical protein
MDNLFHQGLIEPGLSVGEGSFFGHISSLCLTKACGRTEISLILKHNYLKMKANVRVFENGIEIAQTVKCTQNICDYRLPTASWE